MTHRLILLYLKSNAKWNETPYHDHICFSTIAELL